MSSLTYKKVKISIGNRFFAEYKINNISTNTFEYQDDTCLNKIELFSDKVIFTRENAEFILVMDNTKDTAFYKLKELNYELDIKINYFDKMFEENKLILIYQLETTDNEISLTLE